MIRYDWLPYTKRRLGHKHTDERSGEDREKEAIYTLRKTTLRHLDLRLPPEL